MYIYNITTNVDHSIAQKWLEWVQKTHIPAMLATGKFSEAKLNQVMVNESQGITYAIQYTAESKAMLVSYFKEDKIKLQKEAILLFGSSLVSFETELKIINHIKAK